MEDLCDFHIAGVAREIELVLVILEDVNIF